MDRNIYRAQRIILRERALSYLRVNKVEEAYKSFLKAKDKFSLLIMIIIFLRVILYYNHSANKR